MRGDRRERYLLVPERHGLLAHVVRVGRDAEGGEHRGAAQAGFNWLHDEVVHDGVAGRRSRGLVAKPRVRTSGDGWVLAVAGLGARDRHGGPAALVRNAEAAREDVAAAVPLVARAAAVEGVPAPPGAAAGRRGGPVRAAAEAGLQEVELRVAPPLPGAPPPLAREQDGDAQGRAEPASRDATSLQRHPRWPHRNSRRAMMPMPSEAGGTAREEAVEAGPLGRRASAAARFPKQLAAADAGSSCSSSPTAARTGSARRAERKAAAPSPASAKSTRLPGPSKKSLTVRARASAAAVRVLEGAMPSKRGARASRRQGRGDGVEVED
jgi:hypothetical protein